MLEDYRAGLTIDREHDAADREAGRKVTCPMLLVWASVMTLSNYSVILPRSGRHGLTTYAWPPSIPARFAPVSALSVPSAADSRGDSGEDVDQTGRAGGAGRPVSGAGEVRGGQVAVQ